MIYPWKAHFDPYVEEIKYVDLWVSIPKFSAELLNFDSVANMLASNNIGALIKLDARTVLKHKIRFVRACVRVDISEPLLEYDEITRAGGIQCGYVIWYEDFSVVFLSVDVMIIVLMSV